MQILLVIFARPLHFMDFHFSFTSKQVSGPAEKIELLGMKLSQRCSNKSCRNYMKQDREELCQAHAKQCKIDSQSPLRQTFELVKL